MPDLRARVDERKSSRGEGAEEAGDLPTLDERRGRSARGHYVFKL